MTHLAEQAKHIFETMGAPGLQNFIRHARNAPYTDPVWTHGNTGISLADDSAIRHCRNQCTQRPDELPHLNFLWQHADGSFEEAIRPATPDLPPCRAMDENIASMALLNWPTTESIHSTMLEIACGQAGIQSEHLPETPLGLAIIDTLAPDSRRAINEEILDDPQPSMAMDHLANLQHDYAVDAIIRLPQAQWDALVNYLRQNHSG